MKKNIILIILAVVCVLESIYILKPVLRKFINTEKSDNIMIEDNPTNSSAEFSDTLKIVMDGRNFMAEDAPENDAEKIVLKLYLADFLNDSQLREDCLASDGFEIELANCKQQDLNGEKINTCIIHEIETISVALDSDGLSDFGLHVSTIQDYSLTEYKAVKLRWTEERVNPANYGNGLHERYFICGKRQEDSMWRIYEFGFM